MRLPDFLIIGGMRCGTTSLYELLRSQGEIFFPQKKELHFFDHRNPQLQDAQGYAAEFSAAPEHVRCGEATPDYLTSAGCAEAIRDLLPQARLIALLRDPVERAWSHYQFSCFHKVESKTLDDALSMEPERLALATDHSDIFFSYQQRGRYIEHLQRYEALFGRERLHVILLDELVADTGKALQGIMLFLGCDLNNVTPVAQLPSLNRTVSYLAMASSKPHQGLWQRLRTKFSGAAPALPAQTRARLQKYFDPYNRALQDWLRRPIPW